MAERSTFSSETLEEAAEATAELRFRVKLVEPGRQDALANAGALIKATCRSTGTEGGEPKGESAAEWGELGVKGEVSGTETDAQTEETGASGSCDWKEILLETQSINRL